MDLEHEEFLFTGTPISRGIAIGHPFFFTLVEDEALELSVGLEEIEAEVIRYQCAIAKARKEIKSLQKSLQDERIFDAVAILDAHLQIMQDPLLTTHVENEIRSKQKNADYVFQEVIKEYQNKFNSLADSFFRERFKDIQEISRRVICHLREHKQECISNTPNDSIIFATDLTAFDTAKANSRLVGAFVTRDGGATSHAGIVAKARGIPYVSCVDLERVISLKKSLVIVDGRTGTIIFNPSPTTLEKYRQLKTRLSSHLQKLNRVGQLEAETYDGYRIRLSANVETIAELEVLHQFGGSGVGLLRTESLFLSEDSFPSEEKQFTTYRRFVENMRGLPIVIRTFDFGGDKNLRTQPHLEEANPFLGCRAIRLMLREKKVFKTHLRAILRASAYGDISIMFPMISALSELLEAKAILKETQEELLASGEKIADYISVGCMIEVPSAAIIADLLAKECDFFSIGTNDLVQYTLAVDRTNNALSNVYMPTHPSVIRLIKLVISEANHHGIPVSICGEVAADPRFTPLLLGLGVHELSVAPRYLTAIKNAIRNTSIVEASKLVEEVLTLSSATEIEMILNREYRLNVPEDCFYNC